MSNHQVSASSATAWHCSEAPEAAYGAKILAQVMLDRFPAIKSVADVGCSIGIFLKEFSDNGVPSIYGFDADWVDQTRLVIPAEAFTVVDLAEKLPNHGQTFDLLVCMEVAEHLPAHRAASFVEELTERSRLILFSAAIPGQGGVGHVNEQWQSYWRELFLRNGYAAYDFVRNAIWNDAKVPFWYRQNVMLYSAEPLKEPEAGELVDVVHPEQYKGSHYIDVGPGMYLRDKMTRVFARYGFGGNGK